MFSATFPEDVQKIAQKYMRSYVFVAVGRVGSTIESISQRIVHCPANDKRTKLGLLLPLLDRTEKTLVFCQKKHVASWLRGQITKELGHGVRVDAIHGDRSQSQRESALGKFRDGELDILVATDVAARGLDVPGITHVIQFDLPVSSDDFDSYVHRIGRTGRAGRLGVATALFVPGMDGKSGQNGALWDPLFRLMTEGKQNIPEWFAELGPRKHGVVGGSVGGGGRGNVQRKVGENGGGDVKQPQKDSRVGVRTVVDTVVGQKTASAPPSAPLPAHDVTTATGRGRQRGGRDRSEAEAEAAPLPPSQQQQEGGQQGAERVKGQNDSRKKTNKTQAQSQQQGEFQPPPPPPPRATNTEHGKHPGQVRGQGWNEDKQAGQGASKKSVPLNQKGRQQQQQAQEHMKPSHSLSDSAPAANAEKSAASAPERDSSQQSNKTQSRQGGRGRQKTSQGRVQMQQKQT
jgi:superfamily II DNA/RNA helicase